MINRMSSATTAEREPYAQSVAAEVRAAAARRRVTQASIARQLGMSQQALSRRWTGELAFDVNELFQVADILGIPLGDLLPPTPMAPRLLHPNNGAVQRSDGKHAQTQVLRPPRNHLTPLAVAHAA